MASLQQKLTISLMSAAVFVLVGLPSTYKLTNSLIGGIANAAGCPSLLGLAVHAGVFYLLSKLSMKGSYASTQQKHKHSLIAAALFALLNSPMAYKMVSGILGSGIANASGCPTMMGLLVHAGVYTAILVLLMGK